MSWIASQTFLRENRLCLHASMVTLVVNAVQYVCTPYQAIKGYGHPNFVRSPIVMRDIEG